jgi:diguanylate cyclase (GGDEF)-like protein
MLQRRGEPRSEAVRLACLDTVNRGEFRSALFGFPAATLLAVIFGASVPVANRIAFIVCVSVADVAMFLVAWHYLRRRRRGERIGSFWQGPACAFAIGCAWATVPLIAFPPADSVELRMVYLLFVCGVSATSAIGTAAERSYFYGAQVPLLTIATVAFWCSPERVTHLTSYAIPVYFIVLAFLHHEVHTVVVSELVLKERNDETNRRLVDANERLTELAMRDHLTGLASRAAFVEMLELASAAARRSSATIGVLYFDLDRFKVVNDSLGHAAGDDLLVQVATRVRRALRPSDVLARLGGDEFTVLLDQLARPREAVLVAERVQDAFSAPFELAGRRVTVTASIGIATNTHDDDGAEELLRHADAAQYRAKEGGRNRIEVFDHEFRDSLARRLDDEQALREALDADQITAWYQPLVDLGSGRIVGAEALARWIHPTAGTLEAPAFVPLAEESGMIVRIDEAVLRAAVSGRVRIGAERVDPTFRVWCNVSARQLTRGEPAARLAALLERTGCAPGGMGIEITETAVLPDVDAAARQIAAARAQGVRVALDDFGTGNSSLTLLRELDIDSVKIDRSFVADLGVDPIDTAIVRNVAALACDLGLSVVGEGVETPAQARLLAQLGCGHGQGYLWSEAVPLDRFLALLTQEDETPSWLARET